MPNPVFPFAVRLIGFSNEEAYAFEAGFAAEQGKGCGYFRLEEDNLQDPDLYIANTDSLKALITLNDLRPCQVRPALLVGAPGIELPYPRVPRPIDWRRLLDALDELVEKRADALSRLEASDIVIVPERRRRNRLDLDLTDPADYEKMRAKIPENGALLLVDKNPAFHDYLSELLVRQRVPSVWASDDVTAVELCKQQSITVAMINTATPGVDPYRLCRAIKEQGAPLKTTVIFLIGKPFAYDVERARAVGVEGFLNKPLAGHHLISVLRKFFPSPRTK